MNVNVALPKLGQHVWQKNWRQLKEELVKDVSHSVQRVIAETKNLKIISQNNFFAVYLLN